MSEKTTDAVMASQSDKGVMQTELFVARIDALERRNKDLLEANVRFENQARMFKAGVDAYIKAIDKLIPEGGADLPDLRDCHCRAEEAMSAFAPKTSESTVGKAA